MTQTPTLAPQGIPEGNKALTKALTILCTFTEATPEWGVSELSRHLGVGKSSVSNHLATLAAFGLVQQDPVTRRFRLGLGCMSLGYLAANRLAIRDVAYPYLEELRESGEWIVYMAVPWQRRVLYVEALYPHRRRINYSAQGRLLPMYCTGIGKAILAWLPEEERDSYLRTTELHAFTPNTHATPAALRKELEATRQRGYAVDRQEHERGIQCVAAPVLLRGGTTVAAISISGAANHVPEERFADLAERVTTTASEIARLAASRL